MTMDATKPKSSGRKNSGSAQKFVIDTKEKLKKLIVDNWLKFIVLLFALGVSAASTAISYEYANTSINSLNSQLRTTVLQNIQIQIADYLDASKKIIPVAKRFVEDRIITTENVVDPSTDPAIKTSLTYLGRFYRASNLSSLFHVDVRYRNLGWGMSAGNEVIMFVWEGFGYNIFSPVNGSIGNFSKPLLHSNTIPVVPAVSITNATRAPFWGRPRAIQVGATEEGDPLYEVVIPYSEPAYFTDTKQFIGVVGSDINLNEWKSVLASYQIGISGKVFLAGSDGTLYADSNAHVQTSTFIAAVNNTDPFLRAGAEFVVSRFGSFASIPVDNQDLEFKYNGAVILVLIGQIQTNNLRLVTVVMVPRSDFTGRIDESRNLTIGLTVAASVMGGASYIPWNTIWKWLKKKFSRNTSTTPITVYPAKQGFSVSAEA